MSLDKKIRHKILKYLNKTVISSKTLSYKIKQHSETLKEDIFNGSKR